LNIVFSFSLHWAPVQLANKRSFYLWAKRSETTEKTTLQDGLFSGLGLSVFPAGFV
jgi:hypothetical protein